LPSTSGLGFQVVTILYFRILCIESPKLPTTQHSFLTIFKMNCPSRTEEPAESDGMNQNPPSLSADLTTRNDLNGMANKRVLGRSEGSEILEMGDGVPNGEGPSEKGGVRGEEAEVGVGVGHERGSGMDGFGGEGHVGEMSFFMRMRKLAITFGKFIGPGFMVNSFLQFDCGMLLIDFLDRCGLYRSWQLCN
jgi:hypothetical protein